MKKKRSSKNNKPNPLLKFPFGGFDSKENAIHRIKIEIIILIIWFLTFWIGLYLGKML